MRRNNLAREVLGNDEYAEYVAFQRHLDIPTVSNPPLTPHLADEHGYDREGRYYPERDMG